MSTELGSAKVQQTQHQSFMLKSCKCLDVQICFVSIWNLSKRCPIISYSTSFKRFQFYVLLDFIFLFETQKCVLFFCKLIIYLLISIFFVSILWTSKKFTIWIVVRHGTDLLLIFVFHSLSDNFLIYPHTHTNQHTDTKTTLIVFFILFLISSSSRFFGLVLFICCVKCDSD